LSILYQLVLADFRERTRSYSFLVTMLGILFFGYLVITGKYTIQFGDCRTVYDSTWAGTLMAVCSSIMLAIPGFYLVKGSIGRDRRTEVGQIIAATPISRTAYIVSKFASNVAVLWFMITVLATVAFATLLFRNEAGSINLLAFCTPFFIISLPATVFVASMAVLFDTARWLRGSVGNIVYLFLAEICLVLGMLEVPLLDLGAVSLFTDSARSAAAMAFPGETIGLLMGFVGLDKAMQIEVFKIFPWDGIDWTTSVLQLRLFWVGIACVVVATAVPFFDRFDPAKTKRRGARRKTKPVISDSRTKAPASTSELTYQKLHRLHPRFRLVQMLGAELRLALKGYHWFWYIVAVGLSAAQLAAPFDIARLYLTPLSMVWPLVIWSSMGTRELRHNTGPLLFSSPEPLMRQFPAIWLSGLLVALAAVSCMVFRASIAGQWPYATALLVGALFVPTVSLALGTLSGSRKLFEVVYLMIWYVGSIDHLSALDLLGTTYEAVTGTKLVVLVLLSIVSLVAAFSARRMQLQRS